jgi:hypothetical protein
MRIPGEKITKEEGQIIHNNVYIVVWRYKLDEQSKVVKGVG